MSNIFLRQAEEFFARFFRMGGTIAMIKKLASDDALMERWMKTLTEFPEFKLVHGMYNLAADVLETFKARCSDKGIDFAKFTWVGPEISLFEFTDDPSVVVVLDITLDTLETTCDFAYDWASEGQTGGGWRWDGLLSDEKHMRILEGANGFVPYTLRWRRIKLDVDMNRKPEDLRDPQKSPGIVGLFLAAQHPVRIAKTDYEKVFGYWLPGLECTAPDKDPWQNVPYVYFHRGDRQVGFSASWRDDSGPHLAVPMFWEN